MQFSILSVFALAVAVSATSLSQNEGFVVVKRQAVEVPVNTPAMTNAAGEVIPFDSTKVYLDAAAGGQ
ncbi:hypothetical protein RB595_008210 [Gaeumannomyces hyphopodioides]